MPHNSQAHPDTFGDSRHLLHSQQKASISSAYAFTVRRSYSHARRALQRWFMSACVARCPQFRNRALGAFFIVGLCVGLVIAERVYISKGGSVPKPRILQTQYDVHHKRTLAASLPKIHSSVHSQGNNGEIQSTPLDQPAKNDLEALLRKIAPTKEVLVAVANKGTLWGAPSMLETFLNGVKNSGVSNHLVMALDKETTDWCAAHGFNAYNLDLEIHKVRLSSDTHTHHAYSHTPSSYLAAPHSPAEKGCLWPCRDLASEPGGERKRYCHANGSLHGAMVQVQVVWLHVCVCVCVCVHVCTLTGTRRHR